MKSRIRRQWEHLLARGEKALVPYVTPDFPVKDVTVDLVLALEQAGASFVEIGIPFSDPLADGPVIQHASHVALSHGATPHRVLDIVRQIRAQSSLPILLMGYINPILRAGVPSFLNEAVEAGVDGFIIPDMPPEESSIIHETASNVGLSMVYLIAPTTRDERIRHIDNLSTDFTYCVSITGVTGQSGRFASADALDLFLGRVRSNSGKPFVVGFGISTRDDVERVWRIADGAVVGSQLLRGMADCTTGKDAITRGIECITGLLPSGREQNVG